MDKKAAILTLELLLGHVPLKSSEASDPEAEPGPVLEPGEAPPQAPAGPRVLYFDLETQKSASDVGGWNNTHLMRVSVAVVYDSLEKQFFSYTEDHVEELLDHLERADLIVGFNIKRFDYSVLGAYTGKDLKALSTFDILEDLYQRLGFRLGLDHLAAETLNQKKSGDGLQALEWFKKGEMQKLTDYCRHDVEITRGLFEYGLKNGHLIYRSKPTDERVRLRVDWNLEKLLK